jgi:hypothetical protein
MRGGDLTQSSLFSYIGEEERVPKAHPLRKLRLLLDVLLKSMSAELAARYSHRSPLDWPGDGSAGLAVARDGLSNWINNLLFLRTALAIGFHRTNCRRSLIFRKWESAAG